MCFTEIIWFLTHADRNTFHSFQVCILGPLIFIIFGNDFAASGEEGISVLYADDDTDLVHDGNPEKLKEKIQREACRSTEWVSDNRMVCEPKLSCWLLLLINGEEAGSMIRRCK